MKLTKEMVSELNNELAVMGCSFRFAFCESKMTGLPSMEITLPSKNYVHSYIINVSRAYLEWQDMWFKTRYNVVLNCNNTGSVFWCKED